MKLNTKSNKPEKDSDNHLSRRKERINKDDKRGAEKWLNEHGNPDFEYLKSFLEDGASEASEELKSIADNLHVGYNHDISSGELVQRILSVVQKKQGN
jgi:hypothetical protein